MKTRAANTKGHRGKTQPAASCRRVSHPRKTLEEDEKMDRFGDNYELAGRQSPARHGMFSSQLPGGGGQRALLGKWLFE